MTVDKRGTGRPPMNLDEAVRRATAALADLAADYDRQSASDIEALNLAWSRLLDAKDDRDARLDAVYRASHEIRGQAGSFGRNTETAVADMLCSFIDAFRDRIVAGETGPVDGAKAHIDALRHLFASPPRDRQESVAQTLINGLQGVRDKLFDR